MTHPTRVIPRPHSHGCFRDDVLTFRAYLRRVTFHFRSMFSVCMPRVSVQSSRVFNDDVYDDGVDVDLVFYVNYFVYF